MRCISLWIIVMLGHTWHHILTKLIDHRSTIIVLTTHMILYLYKIISRQRYISLYWCIQIIVVCIYSIVKFDLFCWSEVENPQLTAILSTLMSVPPCCINYSLNYIILWRSWKEYESILAWFLDLTCCFFLIATRFPLSFSLWTYLLFQQSAKLMIRNHLYNYLYTVVIYLYAELRLLDSLQSTLYSSAYHFNFLCWRLWFVWCDDYKLRWSATMGYVYLKHFVNNFPRLGLYYYPLIFSFSNQIGFVGELHPDRNNENKHVVYTHKNIIVQYNKDQVCSIKCE